MDSLSEGVTKKSGSDTPPKMEKPAIKPPAKVNQEDILISKQYLKELKEALEWCANKIDWRKQDPRSIKPIMETIKSLVEDIKN